jgi:hypothetical protein
MKKSFLAILLLTICVSAQAVDPGDVKDSEQTQAACEVAREALERYDADHTTQSDHEYQEDEEQCLLLRNKDREKAQDAEDEAIEKFEQAKTAPKPVLVANTITNGHIVLLSNLCPPVFDIKISFQYVILDAFNRPIVEEATGVSGCWYPQGEKASGELPNDVDVKYIIGVDSRGNLTKWRRKDFKKTNHWPK